MTTARELVARAWWQADPGRPARAFAQLGGGRRRSPDELYALRLQALRELLEAALTVPFYRDCLAAAGVAPASLRSPEDIAAIPPLERADLQRLGVAGLSVPGAHGVRVSSSGSIGKPVQVLRPLAMTGWIEASDRRAMEWLGIRLGERIVEVTHMHYRRHSPARRARALAHNAVATLANTATLHGDELNDPPALDRLLDSLEHRPAALVRGVSNTLYAAALVLERSGRQLPARACWSGGAHLPEHYRRALVAAFDCPVHERYASWDVGVIAHQCPEAGVLHVAAESVLVEIVRGDGSRAAPGEIGHVLVTTLRNRAMPLLRYRLGDLAEAPGDELCPCGRELPVLGRLIGRSNDLLHTAGGGLLAPEFISQQMSKASASIVEFQVTQHPDLSLDVKLVQRDDPPPEPYRRQVAAALDELIGLPGAARVERVDDIPLSGAGKLRHVVSHAGPDGEP